MRAEALRYLSEFAVERGVRRAILRKTKATAIADISPGQPCAYWRWRRKGVHKKGGSAMAKFLSWDPEHPGKQAWLRTGPTTTLVSAEQLRAAVGFENWVPSQEDIAMLKDGSQSLKDTVWEDQTGPGPKEDYIMDEFDIEAPALESLPPTPVVVPGTPIPPPVPRLDAHVQHYEHIHQNVNIHSPRYEQVVLQRFGEEPNRGRSRSRTPGTPRRARVQLPKCDCQGPGQQLHLRRRFLRNLYHSSKEQPRLLSHGSHHHSSTRTNLKNHNRLQSLKV